MGPELSSPAPEATSGGWTGSTSTAVVPSSDAVPYLPTSVDGQSEETLTQALNALDRAHETLLAGGPVAFILVGLSVGSLCLILAKIWHLARARPAPNCASPSQNGVQAHMTPR